MTMEGHHTEAGRLFLEQGGTRVSDLFRPADLTPGRLLYGSQGKVPTVSDRKNILENRTWHGPPRVEPLPPVTVTASSAYLDPTDMRPVSARASEPCCTHHTSHATTQPPVPARKRIVHKSSFYTNIL
jgi:hypothetical protein